MNTWTRTKYCNEVIQCHGIHVCHPFELQAMPLGPVGLARGVLQAVWDKKSPSRDENSSFGPAISKLIAFAN
jgi:hypothetical protein